MIKMKNIISFFVSVIVIVVVVLNIDIIVETIKNISFLDREIVLQEANEWEKDYEFMYFKESDDFIPNNYDELVEIFYTTLDKGWNEFTFYCGDEYENCIEDVILLSDNEKFLAEVNNFVHPYNSYETIKTYYDKTGEVTIKVFNAYSEDEILVIDRDIKKLMSENLRDDMSLRDKIKTMHDVIINNTKYDIERVSTKPNKDKNEDKDTKPSKYDSERIQGVLYDHYAVCSGYTDIMAVILTNLEVPNFMIASEEHVWNAVFIDNRWYHLDLTWDDPISSSGRDILVHDWFLISDAELTKLDMKATKREHIYNKDIYLEFK